MGKGSNVQKAQAARERNQKNQGKTEEERRASAAKAKADSAAFMCQLCRQTFMVNAKPPVLYLHVTSKHDPGTDPLACFPDALRDFDPEDPEGTKKAQEDAKKAAEAAARRRSSKKANADLDDLLNAGLGGMRSSKR
jgi:arylsulfatase A-like enzyme